MFTHSTLTLSTIFLTALTMFTIHVKLQNQNKDVLLQSTALDLTSNSLCESEGLLSYDTY